MSEETWQGELTDGYVDKESESCTPSYASSPPPYASSDSLASSTRNKEQQRDASLSTATSNGYRLDDYGELLETCDDAY
jgi:hypothetical protein